MDTELPLDSKNSCVIGELDRLFTDITQLAKSSVSVDDFFQRVLEKSVVALAAHGGAVWLADANSELRLTQQIRLDSLEEYGGPDVEYHRRFLSQVFRSAVSQVLPPGNTQQQDLAPNPTRFLLIAVPLVVDRKTLGVLELVQRPADSPAGQRGNLRIASTIAEIAGDFLRRHELPLRRVSEETWHRFAQFVSGIHAQIRWKPAMCNVVNEAASMLNYDRVSLVVRKAWRFRVEAISGVDSFDRRSNVIRGMEELADGIATATQPLRFDSHTTPTEPYAHPIRSYVAKASPVSLWVLPLRNSSSVGKQSNAILIAEQFSASEDLPHDVRLRVWHQIQSAINNAIDFERSRFGIDLGLSKLHQSSRRLLWAATALVLGISMLVMKADFNVRAEGELQPVSLRNVFAPANAEVVNLNVEHDQYVDAGDVLIRLEQPELDLELQRLKGEYDASLKRLMAVENARLRIELTSENSVGRSSQLTAEEEELKLARSSAEQQMALLRKQREQLQVRSPIAGRIMTWDTKQLLESRPVQRGQKLLSVADFDGVWMIELQVPENRIGYVLSAQKDEQPLKFTYSLATEPGSTYVAYIHHIGKRAEIHDGSHLSTVKVTAKLDPGGAPDLRAGAMVTAKLNCGKKAVGYVWLHDLIEKVRGVWF